MFELLKLDNLCSTLLGMKFSMLLPCPKCGKRLTIETKGDEPFPNPQCECGAFIWLVQSDMRVSRRALCRAESELQTEDFSLAIILSAMAVECELAFLHSKWKMLDANLVPSEVTPSHSESWEKEFHKLPGGVGGKLDALTQLMTSETFDAFLIRRNELAAALQKAYPDKGTTSPRAFFVAELFRKRNKILHSGQVQFGKPEAEACVSMAMSLLQIIGELDKERIARLDKEL